jgi:hypothetical protein
VIFGGIVAGVICFFGDAIVHGILLNSQWAAIVATMRRNDAANFAQRDFGYFAIYDLLKGVLAVWIFAAALPRFGSRFSTALMASLTVWLLVIPVPTLGLIPMAFFPGKFVLLWSIYGLIPIVIGTLAGAMCYRESAAFPPGFKSEQYKPEQYKSDQ